MLDNLTRKHAGSNSKGEYTDYMPLTGDDVLSQIFGPDMGSRWDETEQEAQRFPEFHDVRDLANLLATDPTEEMLQQLIEKHPQFLIAGGCALAIFSKPSIGDKYRADFAILDRSQSGCEITLVEIERSSGRLFTAAGQPAEPLRRAMVQVQNWSLYLQRGVNQHSFVNEKVKDALRLPQYPERSPNGSCRFTAKSELDRAWRDFGGYDLTFFTYSIIIGRWANMNEEERSRLIHLNQSNPGFSVGTYDQMARRAFESRFWPDYAT